LRPKTALRLLSLLTAIVLFTPRIAAAQSDFKDVRMAGTFNNWSTTDDAYRLTKTSERYELVRFWPCGEYNFKFVFNGSWDRHLGDNGSGDLQQPGQDITLTIPQSAEYSISLEPQNRRWSVKRSRASHPHAVIIMHGDTSDTVLFDGRASIARKEHPIKTYTWQRRVLPNVSEGHEPSAPWQDMGEGLTVRASRRAEAFIKSA